MNINDLLSIEFLQSMHICDWSYTEELVPRSYKEFSEWVAKDYHGPLSYLADERKEKREHLGSILPGTQSALVFLFDYSEAKKIQLKINPDFKIASYSIGFEGEDYHFWIKDKLTKIAEKLTKSFSGLEWGVSLDVHPVLERDLAFRSGLGWFGKNSMLINKKYGSYTIIGSLLLNQKLDMELKKVDVDHCGTCTKCIDACPTNAINGDMRTLDAGKCISTYTIELFKDAAPPEGFPTQSNEVFGCDICQEVCPWNKKPVYNSEREVNSELVSFFNRDLVEIIKSLEEMSNKGFKTFFMGTSFHRLGKRGLLKNLYKYQDSL